MKVLLDTHVILLAATEPERLGDAAAAIENIANEVLISAASSWEIAIKWALGKLPLPEPPDRYVPHLIRELGATPVPIEHGHALAVAALPRHHRDPFDRMLVAQARIFRVPVVTSDTALHAYDVEILRAG